MLNQVEILSTLKMIESDRLDVRTITMGLSLRDCIDTNAEHQRKNHDICHIEGERQRPHGG